MKTRLFHTDGNLHIIEEEWIKPAIKENEIEVKSIYTGICRSDLDMHCGLFQLLPKHIQGHESLGVVTKVGKSINHVKEGDFVATRGEPAFADYYNCPETMFVKVPEANPKYILEPVACGINIAKSFRPENSEPVLIFGSGFLATIVVTMIQRYWNNPIIVVGNANKDFWAKKAVTLITDSETLRDRKFNHIIDLSDKPEYLDLNVYAERATIILAAEKHPNANLSFAQFLWNAVEMKFPSPRNGTFYDSMVLAEELVRYNELETTSLWTKSYDRDTQVNLGFSEGLLRPPGYSRGYIEWQR